MGKIYSIVSGKYIVQRTDKNGYKCASIYTNKQRKNVVVHILVATLFIRNLDPVNKIYVNHINSKRDDNNYDNLEWVTQSENIIHAYKYGGLNKKLKPVSQCDESFNEIRRFVSASEAARTFGVNGSAIYQACNGKYPTTRQI